MNLLLQTLRGQKSIDRLCEHTYLASLLDSDSKVLDLGANRGQFCRGMISRYRCRVFAVEPVAELQAGITELPGLTLLSAAVGGRNERARLNIFGSRCASLLHRKDDDVLHSEEDVEVLDLQTVMDRLRLDRIDLMKVDIEGAELGMFDSASDATLLKCTQITVEFHDFIYPEQRHQVESIKARLGSLGFWIINFSLDNTDVLFINAASSRLGRIQYAWLKYVTKYMRGIRRRLRAWQKFPTPI